MKSIIFALALCLPLSIASSAKEPKSAELNTKCPVTGKPAVASITAEYEGKKYAFADEESRDTWQKTRKESLYHRLGGKAAISAAVDSFYVKVLADDRINFFFEDVGMKRQHNKQKAFLAAAFGGPEPWGGKDMRTAHEDIDGLKEEHFNAVAGHLQATLKELGIDEKLIGEVMTIAASTKDDVLGTPKKK